MDLCRDGDFCESTEEISNFAESLYISVFVRAQKYDSNEYESNPVSYKLTEYTTRVALKDTL